MGNKTLVYKQKVIDNLNECNKHLLRLNTAFDELNKKFNLPLNFKSYQHILNNTQYLAYSDQIIYRFSKLQDSMGAKLFKSILLYQGENVDKPFLDILGQLEKIDIVNIEEWFELRDLRNEISHDYDDNDALAINILNTLYTIKDELKKILNNIKNLLNAKR